MVIKTLSGVAALGENQYYKAEHQKKHIFLHHTAGSSALGAISWWNAKPDHVSTPFLIERDGTVIEAFNPEYWAYALGLKTDNATSIEKASIHIELVAMGQLTKRQDKFYFLKNTEVDPKDVVTFKNFYRDCYYYHKYTDAQIKSLVELIHHLVNVFGIKVQSSIKNFWFYDKSWTNKPQSGIWSHSTVRADKSDIIPQKELIEALYNARFGM